MTGFWQLPYGVLVWADDSQLQQLERLADVVRKSYGEEWDMEFHGDQMHFRFQTKHRANVFAIFSGCQWVWFHSPPDAL